jgi:hypothetical protein
MDIISGQWTRIAQRRLAIASHFLPQNFSLSALGRGPGLVTPERAKADEVI